MIKHFVVVFLMVSALALMFGSGLYYGQGLIFDDLGVTRHKYFATKGKCEEREQQACGIVGTLGFAAKSEIVDLTPKQDNSI